MVLSDPTNTIGAALTLSNMLATGLAVVGLAYFSTKAWERYKECKVGLPNKKTRNLLGVGLLCIGALAGQVALLGAIIGDSDG